MLRTVLRNLLAHKARQIMTVLAVRLGVAFVSGTLVFADTTTEAHRAAASRNFGDLAVTVTAKERPPGSAADRRAGVLDEALARKLAAVRAVVAGQGLASHSVQRALVRTDDGAVTTATEKRLRSAVGHNPLLKVQDRRQFVDEAAGTMADLLNVMYGMLAIGVVIAALGIVNTLAVSVTERTREIGALRALGMDRAGVRRMIRLEAVTVAAFGTLLGLAGGVFGAWLVGSLANGAIEQYTFALPWGTLLLVCPLSLMTGVLAAAVPARRAAALSPLEAVAEA